MKLGCDTFLMSQWYKKDDNAEPAVFYFLPITDVLPNYDNDDPQKSALKEKVWSLVTSKATSNCYEFWLLEEKNYSITIAIPFHYSIQFLIMSPLQTKGDILF